MSAHQSYHATNELGRFGHDSSLFALLLRLVSLLRLTIPLGYAVVVSLCFGEWYHAHEVLGDSIFFVLLGMVAISWVISIVRKIRAWA